MSRVENLTRGINSSAQEEYIPITTTLLSITNCINVSQRIFIAWKKFLITWNISELPMNKVSTVPSIIAYVSYKHLTEKKNVLF
jgi:hypothetical protein